MVARRGDILVVDDESESLRLLTNILTAEGYDVRPADTGELALASVSAKPPELILLDIRMPGQDGFEICHRLKARPETRDIPLMFISSAHEVEERVEGLRLGAVDFVSKPFRSEELLARVRTHLEVGRLRTRLATLVAERTAELLTANQQLRRDLGEIRRAEQALRESEERFRDLADTAPVIIWSANSKNQLTFCNRQGLTFTGRTIEQLSGTGWTQCAHPDDLRRLLAQSGTVLVDQRTFQFEARFRRADGEYRWLMNTGIPRFVAGVHVGYIGTLIDITDHRLNQEQVLARQKLESLGVLSAGIAHDFNNMLGSIFAEADLAFAGLPTDSPAREHLDRICGVTIRGSEILNLMMDYAGGKGEAAAFEPVDLSALIGEMFEFLKVSLSKKAVFKTSLSKDLPAVRANSSQIRRVVMNLITNASEALEDKEGSISAITSLVHLNRDSRSIGGVSLPEADYVLLEVSDTGCGMTDSAIAKVFDPFYTTKSLGRGLGLSAVQGILRQHGGAIGVVSALGKGSTFQLFLPCEAGQLAKTRSMLSTADRQFAPANRISDAAHRTILLVEDEDTLRLAVSMSLEKSGFSVIAAGDGHDALDLFYQHTADIDAILLDLTLPGLSSAELFREVRRARPDVRILLTSAYDRGRILAGSEFAEDALCSFIRKPYRISELLRMLQEHLV